MTFSHIELDCPFCLISDERIVLENAVAFAIFDAYPVVPLHTLVIPKRHFANYFMFHDEELVLCNQLVDEMHDKLLLKDGSIMGFNIGVNVGEVAGQTIGHCHIHLIPRRTGDVENPRGGIRHVIPGKGYY